MSVMRSERRIVSSVPTDLQRVAVIRCKMRNRVVEVKWPEWDGMVDVAEIYDCATGLRLYWNLSALERDTLEAFAMSP